MRVFSYDIIVDERILMSIIHQTEIGEIVVDNTFFAEKIAAVIMQIHWKGKFIPATQKGKPLWEDGKFSIDDFADTIEIIQDEKGFTLTVPVIAEFGLPLKINSEQLIKAIFEEFGELSIPLIKVIIHLVGVKSRLVAKRDIYFSAEKDEI